VWDLIAPAGLMRRLFYPRDVGSKQLDASGPTVGSTPALNCT